MTERGAGGVSSLRVGPAAPPVPRLAHHAVRAGSAEAMREALDTHLARGFDIESASDGWVLLRRRGERLALTHVPDTL
jgi:hypothetical protein